MGILFIPPFWVDKVNLSALYLPIWALLVNAFIYRVFNVSP